MDGIQIDISEIEKLQKKFHSKQLRMVKKVKAYAIENIGNIKYEKEIKEMASEILMFCNSFNRFLFFHKMSKHLPPKVYWQLLADAYTVSDDLYLHRHKIRRCFSSEHPFREYLMNKRERAFFEKLPDTVIIYRGMTVKEYDSGKHGLSWTLSYKVAKFYRDMYRRNYSTALEPKTIKELCINKSQIVAYFNGRKESEIIYLG